MIRRLSDVYGNDVDSFLLEAQKGDIPGCEIIWRTGVRNTADTTLSDVWSIGGTYNLPSVAVPLYLWSTTTDIQLIFIEGLDANYNYQFETLTLTGVTPVLSTKTWLRVNDIHNHGTLDLVGTVYASRVSGSTTVSNLLASIPIGANRSQMTMYTVPAGYTGYLFQGSVAVGKGKDAVFYWKVRATGSVFVTADSISVYQQALSIDRPFLPVYEKFDLKVSVTLDMAALVQASFGIVILSNEIYGVQATPLLPH